MKIIELHVILTLYCIVESDGWRAVPANQAMYASHSQLAGMRRDKVVVPDEDLPRSSIHSIYKFGYCTPDAVQRQFLRKTANLTLATWQDTQTSYIYLIQDKHTQRFRLQCIVMKTMVPRKYLFRRSRMPLYYCQGILFYTYFELYQRFEIHEFYLSTNVNMPATFLFEFYHAPPM